MLKTPYAVNKNTFNTTNTTSCIALFNTFVYRYSRILVYSYGYQSVVIIELHNSLLQNQLNPPPPQHSESSPHPNLGQANRSLTTLRNNKLKETELTQSSSLLNLTTLYNFFAGSWVDPNLQLEC